jgi:hypothetical protein
LETNEKKREDIIANKNEIILKLNYLENQNLIRKKTTLIAVKFLDAYEKSNFLEYRKFNDLLIKNERIKNHQNFLENEKIDLDHYESMKEFYDYFLNDDKISARYCFLNYIFNTHIHKLFNMEACSWSPLDPIEKLSQLIENKGALFAGPILLGSEHSLTPPQIMENDCLNGYEIWGWENFQPNTQCSGHAVVVIGTDNQNVFFIDPAEPSDPDKMPKCFRVPYTFFCDKIHCTLGLTSPIKVKGLTYLYSK